MLLNTSTPRGRYLIARQVNRAMGALVALMSASASASAEAVAAFIRRQPVAASMNLSWRIEDASHPGTFAEAVFNILAD